jgi:hypothetical protein
MHNSTLPNGVINPFSEKFLEIWQLWKDFRWQEHKFKYKGNISEQMAIVKLNDLCGGDESTAIEMIKQSIANGWMGFYQLKTIKLNGKQQSSNSPESTRKSLNTLYNQRFGSRG